MEQAIETVKNFTPTMSEIETDVEELEVVGINPDGTFILKPVEKKPETTTH